MHTLVAVVSTAAFADSVSDTAVTVAVTANVTVTVTVTSAVTVAVYNNCTRRSRTWSFFKCVRRCRTSLMQ